MKNHRQTETIHTPFQRRTLGVAAVMAGIILLGGCVSNAPVQVSAQAEDELAARAKAYWTAMKAKDHVTAWAYEDVSLDPDWTLQTYLKRVGGVVYQDVQVGSSRLASADEAEVQVKMRYDVPVARLKNVDTTGVDKWRKINGRWYHVRRTASQP